MTTLSSYQFAATDRAGNVIAGAEVTIRREYSGFPLASLYSDVAGAVALPNPVTSDSDGWVSVFLAAGQYKVEIRSRGDARILRYVQVGTAIGASAGTQQTFDTGTADANPGTAKIRFNNSTLASVTAVYLSTSDIGGADISGYLDTWDDTGATANRGTLEVRGIDDKALFAVLRVKNSVATASGYRKLSVDFLAGSGVFSTYSGDVVLSFARAGTPGDVVGPASSVSGNITTFADTTGKLIQDSGKAHSTDGTFASNSDNKIPTEKAVKTYAVGLNTTGLITVGYTLTPYSAGTKSTGTFTPDPTLGNYQYVTNGGAFTLAAPTTDCAIIVRITNNGSAGSITITGMTAKTTPGDSLTTTNGHKFEVQITRVNGVSTYLIVAMQ